MPVWLIVTVLAIAYLGMLFVLAFRSAAREAARMPVPSASSERPACERGAIFGGDTRRNRALLAELGLEALYADGRLTFVRRRD
jgi:hypothetical protein